MSMWDWESLWLKAKAYVDKAHGLEHNDPDFGLWSALALELLGRAALSRISPALNADPRDEKNLFYALGLPGVEQPRSIPAHSVSARLQKFVVGFEKPQGTLFDYMALRRNLELHTGELAFAAINPDTWRPRFYAVCKILCEALGMTLKDFLGAEDGAAAETIVAAFATAQEKAVKDKISQHKKDFEAKPTEERAKLVEEAGRVTRLLPGSAVRRDCPACGSKGILRGEFVKERAPVYTDGELLIDNEYLATEFRCPACELHLATIDEVGLAGVDLHFTLTEATDLHERAESEWDYEYENM